MHVKVSMCQEHVAKRLKDMWLITAKVVREDQIQRCARLRLMFIVPVRAIPSPTAYHLVGRQTEEEEILLTCFFCHFDSGAITRADGQSAIHHELHVACSAGFVPCGGDLIRNIAPRNQLFSKRDTVLGQEQYFEASTHNRIAIDRSGEVVEELNDQFGEGVRRGCFSGEEECAGRHLEIRIFS